MTAYHLLAKSAYANYQNMGSAVPPGTPPPAPPAPPQYVFNNDRTGSSLGNTFGGQRTNSMADMRMQDEQRINTAAAAGIAGGYKPPAAPQAPAPQGSPNLGLAGAFGAPGGWEPKPPSFGGPAMAGLGRPPAPPAGSYQAVGQTPQQPQQPDFNALFRNTHGSAFDPNSRVDRAKMQQMQQWASATPGAAGMTPNTFARNFYQR